LHSRISSIDEFHQSWRARLVPRLVIFFSPWFLTGKSAFCAAICWNESKLCRAVNLCALVVLIFSGRYFLSLVVFEHSHRLQLKIAAFIVYFQTKK